MSDIFTDLREIKERIEAAERAVLANVGPSPVLVELRKALAVIEEWDE